jgi:hypothetical protein
MPCPVIKAASSEARRRRDLVDGHRTRDRLHRAVQAGASAGDQTRYLRWRRRLWPQDPAYRGGAAHHRICGGLGAPRRGAGGARPDWACSVCRGLGSGLGAPFIPRQARDERCACVSGSVIPRPARDERCACVSGSFIPRPARDERCACVSGSVMPQEARDERGSGVWCGLPFAPPPVEGRAAWHRKPRCRSSQQRSQATAYFS